VLSDHEQRAFEELERSFAAGPSDELPPGQPGPSAPPGILVVTVLGCLSVVLLVT
jgi:hypothetical protein